jgi:glycine cleavage system H protein
MEFLGDRVYSPFHLWVRLDSDPAVIGITEYAGKELGEIDYVELPEPDDRLVQDEPFGTIETSKAVTDLIAPLDGIVVESNTALLESPKLLTEDPYGEGWIAKVKPSDPGGLGYLMSAEAYAESVRILEEE